MECWNGNVLTWKFQQNFHTDFKILTKLWILSFSHISRFWVFSFFLYIFQILGEPYVIIWKLLMVEMTADCWHCVSYTTWSSLQVPFFFFFFLLNGKVYFLICISVLQYVFKCTLHIQYTYILHGVQGQLYIIALEKEKALCSAHQKRRYFLQLTTPRKQN